AVASARAELLILLETHRNLASQALVTCANIAELEAGPWACHHGPYALTRPRRPHAAYHFRLFCSCRTGRERVANGSAGPGRAGRATARPVPTRYPAVRSAIAEIRQRFAESRHGG